MDSSLPVAKEENPAKGHFILDSHSELLQKRIAIAQNNASLERRDTYRISYEKLLAEFSHKFYNIYPLEVRNESVLQYELLEQRITRRVKGKLLKYICLLSGGFIGTFLLHPGVCALYTFITTLTILFHAATTSDDKRPTWFIYIKFLLTKLRHTRIAKKIEKLKIH